MAIQKKVLTAGGRGVLALGKPGDIATRAYAPVVRPKTLTAAKSFGDFILGEGILVNSDDCVAIGTKFDTVYGLQAGQTGSILVSGAAIVKKSQFALNTGTGALKVQYKFSGDKLIYDEGNGVSYVSPDWKKVVTWTANVAYELGDYVENGGSYYKCTTATSGDAAFPTAKFTALTGTPAVFNEFAAYAADSLVKESSTATDIYANPDALDGVIEVEVNGLA